jgi:hypothetical protein
MQHQDWNVVVFRKHTNGTQVETKLKQKTSTTLVSVKKLEDNQEDFHHKVIPKEIATEIMKKRLEKKLKVT